MGQNLPCESLCYRRSEGRISPVHPLPLNRRGRRIPFSRGNPFDRAESERPRSPTRFAVELPLYPVALDPGTADVTWTFMEPSPVNLKLLPFFEDFEWRHLEALSASAISVRFEPAQRIFREGEEANRFYLITAGEVAIETAGPDASPIRVMVLKAGDALGWSWLFPPYFWRFDAVSLTPVDAVYFYGTKLRDARIDGRNISSPLTPVRSLAAASGGVPASISRSMHPNA